MATGKGFVCMRCNVEAAAGLVARFGSAPASDLDAAGVWLEVELGVLAGDAALDGVPVGRPHVLL